MQCSYTTKSVRTNASVKTDPNLKKAEKQRDLQRQQQRKSKRSETLGKNKRSD